jgi:hypothetical protein
MRSDLLMRNLSVYQIDQTPAASNVMEQINLTAVVEGRFCSQSWRKNMPIILWLLGVPLIVVIALMVAHVI